VRLAAGVHVQIRTQRDADPVVRVDGMPVEPEVARANPRVVRAWDSGFPVSSLSNLASTSSSPEMRSASRHSSSARCSWVVARHSRLARRAAVTACPTSSSPAAPRHDGPAGGRVDVGVGVPGARRGAVDE